jgi:hypothetical protein
VLIVVETDDNDVVGMMDAVVAKSYHAFDVMIIIIILLMTLSNDDWTTNGIQGDRTIDRM